MSSAPKAPTAVNGSDGTKNNTRNGVKPEVELDVSKLHSLPSEQQELYLFTFLTSFESYLTSGNSTTLLSQQDHLKKELIQIINLQTPSPTRVVRKSLGRCFAYILTKGDRKILQGSITELVDGLSTGKNEGHRNKHAAVYCIGEIYKAAGDSAIQLSAVTCSVLVKLLKSAHGHVALRSAIFKTIGKILGSVKSSIDENVARDIWKQARNSAAGDKGALVQICACWCLEQLIRGTTFFDNASDFESLKSTVWKASDTAASSVRTSSASCLAALLVKSYSETTTEQFVPKIKKPRKNTGAQSLAVDAENPDTSRVASPTRKKALIRLELTLPEILRLLAIQYLRSSTSNRVRAAIICCYSKIFLNLDAQVVEKNFAFIADSLLVDILSSPVIAPHRYRLLLTRSFIQKLLGEVVGQQILGETGQLNAARTLINEVLKNYPSALKEKAEPSKTTLTGALNVLVSLIKSLGSAFSPLADSCREALVQVLQHPSYTVQIHTSNCLRTFVLAYPQQLMQSASICMNSLNRHLGLLGSGRQAARRCVGYANGLAAIISVSPLQPLYSSLEISSGVLTMATSLLKSSVNQDLRISGTQVQVAWVLIGGLMSLGPNFVKIHISQLLLLWRNALPKPLTRENAGQWQAAELSYLMHVRECALGSILSFLEFNSRLITTDVSMRIATLLKNTTEFLSQIPGDRSDGELSPRITPSLQLEDLVHMVRRRVLQCYTRLATRSLNNSKEILTQSNLLYFSILCFADPEAYAPASVSTAVANSVSNFDSLWNAADNCGFGVSGFMRGLEIRPLPTEQLQESGIPWHSRRSFDADLDQLLLSPICGAREHDSVYIHIQGDNGNEELPDPPPTEVVNSAITLFAMALPLQDPRVQEGMLEQLATFLFAKSLQRDPGRKAAVTVNIALALFGALKVAMSETKALSGEMKHPAVEKCMDDLLKALIVDQDQYVRKAAYEAYGRLCYTSGNALTASAVNGLVDIIVANREPNARAGCAMALGSIHSNVGGMAAGYHLRKIHGVLMSLCSDSHPTVHFWAIEALSKVAESAGLTFSQYVPSTLGLLAQLWISDTHCEESDAVGTSNAEIDLPTTASIARCLGSLINVLGPDLQDMSKARDLMLTLVRQFNLDDTPLVQAQAIQCWEHVNLYAPKYVDLSAYVRQLQRGLEYPSSTVREVAINGLYGLIQRDARRTAERATENFAEQIWTLLDSQVLQLGLRSIIKAWLDQTSLSQTAKWIVRCQEILTKTTIKIEEKTQPPKQDKIESAAPEVQDEEVAGFNLADPKDESGGATAAGQELLRWQTRSFALQCLSDILASVGKDLQTNPDSPAGLILQQKVADVIRLAFLSSTSSVIQLRIGGLKLIHQILTIFGKTPDPDFSEALLLEQYQAQISSALTPAFGGDSSPELASAAVNVCAAFISTGLVTDIDRMGRILKLMISALASFTVETGEPAIGDLKGLSTNAQTMVKMAVLSGWAELQVASTEQAYLVDVVKPHITKLTPLWLASLQEFSRLRFEPDISSSIGISPNDDLDTIYAALNRQTLLRFYQDSWLKLVDAIASLIDQDSAVVFDALDGKDGQMNGPRSGNRIDYRNEPVAFFFILFGISFEALVTRSGSEGPSMADQTVEILQALKKILRPSIAGHAIYQDVVFSETMDLFDRLAQTESFEVQGVIVDITKNLCLSHPSVGNDNEDDGHLSDSIEQLFELTRIIVLVVAGRLPNLGEKAPTARYQLSEDATALIIHSLEALVDVADVFPSIIKTDLHACILHTLTTILSTGACQASVVPQMLPIFKRFIQNISAQEALPNSSSSGVVPGQLLGCLQRLHSILTIAQRRELESSLPCAKNTLLATTILLTSGSKALLASSPLITKLLDDLLDCLQDVGLASVAATCTRSLLIATSSSSPTSQAISSYLLPRLLHFYTTTSNSITDPENVRPLIAHALTSSVVTLPPAEVPTAFCILIPALLYRASILGREGYGECAARLLALAGVSQAAFKGCVMAMGTEMKGLMEEVIREGRGVGQDQKRATGAKEEPTIALKFNFG
ncbi:MAG: hypothetical protein MMC33_003495 [Icmadophila ericetorum]|nr:hypothetical protein [Icmadophila ericetorum]